MAYGVAEGATVPSTPQVMVGLGYGMTVAIAAQSHVAYPLTVVVTEGGHVDGHEGWKHARS